MAYQHRDKLHTHCFSTLFILSESPFKFIKIERFHWIMLRSSDHAVDCLFKVNYEVIAFPCISGTGALCP